MSQAARIERAYSLLVVKAIDEDERIITGIASTPEPDRTGDIVEPKGAQFKLPIPLLWQHNSREPIGEVFAAKVTAEGIEVKARIAKIDEPGTLKDRIDEAWQSLKAKLVRGLSIGFKPIEEARINESYSYRYMKWLWLELSCVTIPANADATIQSVKSFDLTATTRGESGNRTSNPPSDPGRNHKAGTMKNVSEKLSAAKAELKTKSARFEELMGMDTLDATQSEERDNLNGEIKQVAKDIDHLTTLEMSQAAQAKSVTVPAPAARREEAAAHVRAGDDRIPKGIGFARYVMCKMASAKSGQSVQEIAKHVYPDDSRLHAFIKAAVAPGLTTDATWAGPLIYPETLAGEFIEYLRPKTIIGKFGTGNIPSLRRVPFNVRMIGQTTGGAARWVGQNKAKPVTKFDFAATSLAWAKIACIAVIADELARFSNPGAEEAVREALAGPIIERIDQDLVDPDVAAVANVSPASLTNGVTPVNPTGTTAEHFRVDFNTLVQKFVTANIGLSTGVLIMPDSMALALSLMVNTFGNPEFPGLTMNGGTLLGFPVITSQYAIPAGSPGDNMIVMASASDIFLSDDGGIQIDMSREASIEMSDDPENESGTVVSMFQNNLTALRAERYINWAKRRTAAVQFIHDAHYTPSAS